MNQTFHPPEKTLFLLHRLFYIFLFTALGASAAGCEFGPPAESVSGTIRLSPSLPPGARRTRILFIILASEKGGPPLAVQRLVRPKFPYKYTLTKDDVMMRGRPFTGRVRVSARLDADGRVGAFVRGDYRSGKKRSAAIGADGADVLIDVAGTAEPPKVAKRPVKSPPPARQKPAAPPRAAAQAPAMSGGAITGRIQIAPALAEKAAGKPVLFIIARTERPGPPLAAQKVSNPRFPLNFTLSGRDVMVPGLRFEGSVRISARLDTDGSAGRPQPGDMEGRAPGLTPVGAKGVTIIIDKEF
jgi:hypothetical protein